MEKIEKAMERRGASIVWAGRGYTLKGGNSRAVGEVQGAGPALSGGREILYRYG